jgi:hypothetical protein
MSEAKSTGSATKAATESGPGRLVTHRCERPKEWREEVIRM